MVYTERMLEPLDMLVDAGFADGLREMEIGVPMSAFWAHQAVGLSRGDRAEFKGSGLKPGTVPEWIVWAPRSRIWRPVGTREYWLGETDDDVTDMWTVHCFGR